MQLDAVERLPNNNNQRPVAFIAMEPVNGGDFFDWVADTGGPFPESIARYFFLQILQGVHMIHSKGYFHGDLKLENMLLNIDYLSDTTKIGNQPWFYLRKVAMAEGYEQSPEYA